MANSSKENSGWQKFCAVMKKVWQIICLVVTSIGHFFKMMGTYVWRIRKILLALPVVAVALFLANYCRTRMPEIVGLGLKETGEYAVTISRDLAVFGPLLITCICLIMMFCSRKTLYPWLISVFSLVLPILIMLTNMILLPF